MIKLLIVDDEQLEIDSIKEMIDFSSLGFEIVGEAQTIRQAREVFQKREVDLILCDIEMPQGSGLELLSWVREQRPATECIFLTCHADFSYARQAITLGSIDYILKPASPSELEHVLQKAARKINLASEQIADKQFSKLWLRHQPLIVERFWLDVLTEKTRPAYDEIRKAAQMVNLPGLEEMRVLPILIKIQNWHESLTPRDETLMVFAMKNIGEELILQEAENGIILELERNVLFALLYLDSTTIPAETELRSSCQKFIKAVNQYIGCDLSCYIGIETYLDDLAHAGRMLQKQDLDNVSSVNQTLTFLEHGQCKSAAALPDISAWALLIDQEDWPTLHKMIDDCLDMIACAPIDSAYLIKFQQDIMQVIYTLLRQHGIQSHLLFGDSQSAALMHQAVESISKMRTWMHESIGRTSAYIREMKKSQSVVSKVQAFIRLNIDKDLSLEEIANQVYLNPSYLTRMFKRETGMGISDFVISERLSEACELLKKTNMNVSTIASRLGYNNFSYFARAFKKQTGMTPLDYRRHKSK